MNKIESRHKLILSLIKEKKTSHATRTARIAGIKRCHRYPINLVS